MVPSPASAGRSTGRLLITVYGLRAASGHSDADGGSPVFRTATTVPSCFFTSIFTAPAWVPSSGGTDWAIHSSGNSKLTVLPGSEKDFHADDVAGTDASGDAASADAEPAADEPEPGTGSVAAGLAVPPASEPA